MGGIKQIIIDKCPYYFSDDMINIKHFDPNLLDIDKISSKSTNIVIYNIKYITLKSINNKNPRQIFNNVNGYIKESNACEYLIFAFTNKNKKVFKKVHRTLG